MLPKDLGCLPLGFIADLGVEEAIGVIMELEIHGCLGGIVTGSFAGILSIGLNNDVILRKLGES